MYDVFVSDLSAFLPASLRLSILAMVRWGKWSMTYSFRGTCGGCLGGCFRLIFSGEILHCEALGVRHKKGVLFYFPLSHLKIP